jgi:hypothetical protein
MAAFCHFGNHRSTPFTEVNLEEPTRHRCAVLLTVRQV